MRPARKCVGVSGVCRRCVGLSRVRASSSSISKIDSSSSHTREPLLHPDHPTHRPSPHTCERRRTRAHDVRGHVEFSDRFVSAPRIATRLQAWRRFRRTMTFDAAAVSAKRPSDIDTT